MVVLCRSLVSELGVGQGVKELTLLNGQPCNAVRRFLALSAAAICCMFRNI